MKQLKSSIMKAAMLLISLLFLFTGGTKGECCYSEESKNLYSSTWQYTIKPASSKLLKSHPVILQFPTDHLIQEAPIIQGGTCTLSSANIYKCSVSRLGSAMQFKVTITGNPTGIPNTMVTMSDEQCFKNNVCRYEDATSKTGMALDPNEGKIDLGPFGYVDPIVFYIAISVIVIAFLGFAFLVWHRNHGGGGTGSEDIESHMIQSRNRSGWFGESSKNEVDNDGYAAFAHKAGKLTPAAASKVVNPAAPVVTGAGAHKERTRKHSGSRPSKSKTSLAAPQAIARRSHREEDDDDDSSDDEALARRVRTTSESERRTRRVYPSNEPKKARKTFQ